MFASPAEGAGIRLTEAVRLARYSWRGTGGCTWWAPSTSSRLTTLAAPWAYALVVQVLDSHVLAPLRRAASAPGWLAAEDSSSKLRAWTYDVVVAAGANE